MKNGTPARGSRPVQKFLQGVFIDRIVAFYHALQLNSHQDYLTKHLVIISCGDTSKKKCILLLQKTQ